MELKIPEIKINVSKEAIKEKSKGIANSGLSKLKNLKERAKNAGKAFTKDPNKFGFLK